MEDLQKFIKVTVYNYTKAVKYRINKHYNKCCFCVFLIFFLSCFFSQYFFSLYLAHSVCMHQDAWREVKRGQTDKRMKC